MAGAKLTHNRSARNALTLNYVRAALAYDKRTGVLRWRSRRDVRPCWNERHSGKVAGTITSQGYRRININGCLVIAHVLIWFYVTGEWPQHETDHVNGKRADNRWRNLRAATCHQNRWNSRKCRRNKSGFKGVHWSKAMKSWCAGICARGVSFHLGFFRTAQQAHAAYCDAATRLHGEFARHN